MADMNAALDEMTTPCVTLEQGVSENWHPATPRDRQILIGMGIDIPYQGLPTSDIDSVLEVVSGHDYWLETIPALQGAHRL